MLRAMYKLISHGCEQLINQAINTLPLPMAKDYVRQNWIKNTVKWAMWRRQHSPLLLQMTSTSPVESYHTVLKRKINSSFGLIGACMITRDADLSYFTRDIKVQQDF